MNVFESKIICKTFHGLENVLAEELQALNARNIEIIKRAVVCDYDAELLYRCNVELRTCLKVLVPVYEFMSESTDDLYNFASRLKWEDYFDVKQSFAIDFTIQSEYFKHSQFAALRLKDAICDHFRKLYDERPSVNTEAPDVLFNLHIHRDKVTISLDSSGTSLHQRGNRMAQNIAPINEVLAAGLVLLSKWDRQSHFVDAMCGSGTILMEAASYAINKAPNLERSYFCFKNWKNYDAALYRKVCKAAEARITEFDYKIIGTDSSKKSIFIAEKNIQKAGLSDWIEVREISIQKMIPPMGRGTLIINPPYGERMQIEELDRLYRQIGDAFKQHFTGYTCGVITSNFEAAKNIGLKPTRKFPVMNGKLDCLFYIYDIYEGSKRKPKTESTDHDA